LGLGAVASGQFDEYLAHQGKFKSLGAYTIKCPKAWWATGLRMGYPKELSKLALSLAYMQGWSFERFFQKTRNIPVFCHLNVFFENRVVASTAKWTKMTDLRQKIACEKYCGKTSWAL